VRLPGERELLAVDGDIVVLPHGQAHTVSCGSPPSIADASANLDSAIRMHPRTLRMGGGGAMTRIVCGFFGCDRCADSLFLAGLPPVFKLNLRSDQTGAWLERTVQQLTSEAESARPGTGALLSKMAEALFVEALRRYAQDLPEDASGWLAGTRDAIVGRALALLHSDAARPWAIDELASEVGTSRSVLGKRFAHLLGAPPMTYLARWRMQLAARSLETTPTAVQQVATEVGYESEAAFNRAFRRTFGVPPAAYRKSCRASAGQTARRASRGDETTERSD
jgi:AraC-like DNA-binding protein